MEGRSSTSALLEAAFKVGHEKYKKSLEKLIEYGTAGFRSRASELDHVIYRMGLLAVLRSKVKKATIGVIITASHNPEEDNGVKLVDPDGEMLEAAWEIHATQLANVSDEKLTDALESIINGVGVDMSQPAFVIFARDTRSSSQRLSEALKAGITALAANYNDFGLLTTPQLHYLVRCMNSRGAYGQPTEVGYYSKLAAAFQQLNANIPGHGLYEPRLWIDGANGIGALKMKEMMNSLGNLLHVVIFNDGSSGKLNHMCGADFVKVEQKVPLGSPTGAGWRCASFDGDGDRLVYYFTDESGSFQLLDGDKIATLMANYIGELVRQTGISSLRIGVIQTAYANGASTDYINNIAKVPVVCVPTGVKHLHHKAQEFDIGVYFEANGHGTVLFQESAIKKVKEISEGKSNTDSVRLAAVRLLHTIDLINQPLMNSCNQSWKRMQFLVRSECCPETLFPLPPVRACWMTVGDAISDLLLVETILRYNNWDVKTWNKTYTDLPNRQLKVKVKDRSLIQTTDAERRMTSPEGLQAKIDCIVAKFSQARSFVRPSGTEDAVRVYAEANTKANADLLAYEVSQVVYDCAGGIGDRPKPPSS